ncbi:MAG: hypothetical protein ABIY70_04835 [Capsulimonas sp.]|uniref:hypothetical protein n=1 Tax=Capsulimonas sp. TaxID=2494211 RepID=UPI003262E18B
MTLTLDLTPQAEAKLSEEAARAGLSLDQYALRLLMEKIADSADWVQKLADEVAGPGYVADLSREAIYAD